MADAVVDFIQSNGWDRSALLYFYDNRNAPLQSVFNRLNLLLLEQNIKNIKTTIVQVYSRFKALIPGRYVPDITGDLVNADFIKETYLITRGNVAIFSPKSS